MNTRKNLIVYRAPKDKFMDNITAVYRGDFVKDYNGNKVIQEGKPLYNAIACCESGRGIYTHVECTIGEHLGERVDFDSLDTNLQNLLINEYKNYTI